MKNISALVLVAALTSTTRSMAEVDATTQAAYDAPLAFTIDGRVQTIQVKPGMKVEAGQVIAQLDDRIHVAQMELDRAEAESEVAVQLARERVVEAELDEHCARQSLGQGTLTSSAYEHAEARKRLAMLEAEQAEQALTLARRRLLLNRARHHEFSLKAPVAGMIEKVLVRPGQVVRPGQPIVRLMRTDSLLVDAPVPTQRTTALKPSGAVWVRARQPGAAPIKGRIVRLSRVIDAKTDTRVVQLEIDNEAGMLVGAHVTVSFRPFPSAAGQ
ncbi:MAG: hypothetical protein CMJ18_04235 [Phycisphaeraceae bacterium]|nr:hypothetical protein [Phycisphaeraceae bacterium]